MFATTGRMRLGNCDLCGREVTQHHARGIAGSESWSSVAHRAPCGAPCLGGGIGGPVRDELKEVYGSDFLNGVHGRGTYEPGDDDGPGDLILRDCPNGCEVPQ